MLDENGQDHNMNQSTGQSTGHNAHLYNEEAIHACPICGLKVDFSVTICPRDGSVIADYSSTEQLLDNRYEVLSLVASGGMGSIYKARQPALNKIVAIKMLRVQNRNDGAWARFQQEAKAASHLEHRNIIRVYDFGQTADGQPYMVMDFVEGVNLQNLIKDEKTLPIEELLNIIRQICAGMTHAHGHHVYHRDLKPSNIMLSQLDSVNPLVRIVDFGIAKVLDSQSEGQNLTQTGEVFGSPHYMSPEQALGKRVDARSDIYSVGCIMHETLTGSVPLSGATSFETLMKHMNDKPLSLRQAKPEGVFSDELVALVLKCLAKDPLKRFQTMQELSTAIDLLPESIAIAQRRGVGSGFTGGATASINIKNLPTKPKPQRSHLASFVEERKLLCLTLLIAVILATGFVYINFGTTNGQKLRRVDSFFHLAKQETSPPPVVPNESGRLELAHPLSDEPPPPTDMTKLQNEEAGKIAKSGTTSDTKTEIENRPDKIANTAPVTSADEIPQDLGSTVIDLTNMDSDQKLAESVKANPGAKTVILKGKYITDEGIQVLRRLPIERLVIQETKLTNKGFAVLADFPNLELLNLRQNPNLDDESLLPLSDMKKLKVLDLSQSPHFSDTTLSRLPHTLQTLCLQGDFRVTEKGFADVCKLSELTLLDVSRTPFVDDEAKLLPKLTKLQKLYIGETCLTDRAMHILGKLPVTELSLEKTRITSKGLMELADMPFAVRIATKGCPYISKQDREDYRTKIKKLIQLEP
jgi:eukaryotic-like serine/threonine-protein kinase